MDNNNQITHNTNTKNNKATSNSVQRNADFQAHVLFD